MNNFSNFETAGWLPIDVTREHVHLYNPVAGPGVVSIVVATPDGGTELAELDLTSFADLTTLLDWLETGEAREIEFTLKVDGNKSIDGKHGYDAVFPVEVGTGREVKNLVACKAESGVGTFTELTIVVQVKGLTP